MLPRERRMVRCATRRGDAAGRAGVRLMDSFACEFWGETVVTRFALIGAAAAALLLSGCSYSTETNVLGYRTSTSFSTPGAAPSGYYTAPPPAAPAPAYTEAPPPGYEPPPAYAPPPVYYAPAPPYYGPYIGIGIGRRWGWGRHRRW